jgi:hypothetical protein
VVKVSISDSIHCWTGRRRGRYRRVEAEQDEVEHFKEMSAGGAKQCLDLSKRIDRTRCVHTHVSLIAGSRMPVRCVALSGEMRNPFVVSPSAIPGMI